MAEPAQQPATSSSHSTAFKIAKSAQDALVETFKYLNEAEIKYGAYSVLRHTRPFVLYQGANTTVPVSVFGPEPLPKDRKVFLQRRGYRTGLFGWTFGGWLGGSKLPGIDVTPASSESWSRPTTLSSKHQTQIQKDISRLFNPDSSAVPNSRLLETLLVHIPVRSGDGYFRLRITSANGKKTIAESPVFRVGSLTWASAHPQGATPLGLVPELGARSLFLTGQAAAWAGFYAAFPFLKIGQMVPGLGPWSQRMLQWAYSAAGGDMKRQELDERFKVSETFRKANDRLYKEVPFGAAGIRTAADLVADDEAGPGGVAYDRSREGLYALLLAARTYGTGHTCCNKLEIGTLEQRVPNPPDADYHVEAQRHWSSTARLSPACVFVPESSSEVATAVKIFVDNDYQFAIRGGGHAPNPGWASTRSGVLISLSELSNIEISDDSSTGPRKSRERSGTRYCRRAFRIRRIPTRRLPKPEHSRALLGFWGPRREETAEHNITVAGGQVSKVGVSGFLLGGGLSFLMHSQGFSANTVLSYEIVLASGEIAIVTSQSNKDLFKALKGGTSNFGVVTSFTLEAYPINHVYAGFLFYDPGQYDRLFSLLEIYDRKGVEADPKTHMVPTFICNPSKNIDMARFYTFHSDPITTPPPVFKPFFDVPTVQRTVQVKTVKEANDDIIEGFDDGLRYDMQTYSIQADAGLFKQLHEIWHSTTIGLNSTLPGWSSIMLYQPVSNNMIRTSEKKGGNILGLKPANDPLIIVSYMFTWLRQEHDREVYTEIKRLLSVSRDIAESQNRLERYIYPNYAGSEQKPIESYGPVQVNFLRKVKAEYDPDGIFENLCRGGFKIPSQHSNAQNITPSVQASLFDQ
ncbi:FAD-binding domain protein [Rhizoctonia solani]|uniref:FAD-binding domain protein n=1 Tax=Rhizoctonia solani TaxID=456999 RepID=A0A8H8NZL6_9AGAM|nr:FAD-binding domain protein [Rhizoctonia solani]QRW20987.1 FAD-binding domain protein [Rhizoctonia solani]